MAESRQNILRGTPYWLKWGGASMQHPQYDKARSTQPLLLFISCLLPDNLYLSRQVQKIYQAHKQF